MYSYSSTTTGTPRQAGKVASLSAALGLLAVGATFSGVASAQAAPPATAGSQRFFVRCDIDPAQLPRTADAAEHWLSTCYRISQLPHTADAIDHWLS